MKIRKSTLITLLLFLLLLAGLSLLLYPTFSNYYNARHQSQAIHTYADDVANLNTDQYDQLWSSAWDYNQSLLSRTTAFSLTEDQREEYNALLNISGSGIMGYIEIPSISVSLPIYHGSDESVLQVAVGHLDWSSLPVGGAGSHCVLSGHRALPSAKLFTDLDKLQTGDVFILRVLDEILTYEVDQILIVEPSETASLQIVPGEDLCTLVTCTPYAVNTHRLLVRGHRIENLPTSRTIRVTADATQIEPLIVAPLAALPILLLFLIVLLIPKRTPHSHGGKADEIF